MTRPHPRAPCPCCLGPGSHRGRRCGACSINCKLAGGTWRRGELCPISRRERAMAAPRRVPEPVVVREAAPAGPRLLPVRM